MTQDVTKKASNNITGMLKQLKKKYPDVYFSIKVSYDFFSHSDNPTKSYTLYIEYKHCSNRLSFNKLRLEVSRHVS